MEITITEETNNTVALAPSGRLDIVTAPDLRDTLEVLLLSGVNRFVIDLSQTQFLDSAGLAVLVSLLKRCRLAGGDVSLVCPTSESVQRILQLTRFDKVFAFVETSLQ